MEVLFNGIFGNETLLSFLADHVKNGTLSHAYLFEGPEGSGRHTLIRLLACALSCKCEVRPCLNCEPCRKILAGICPDVTVTGIEKDKRFISVDAIRAIRDEAYLTPTELDCKIFIIENADFLNTAAQNAFLKILEEPPQRVYFFLIAENASALLPTVQSRAPVLKMQVFGEEILYRYLTESNPKAAVRDRENPDELRLLLHTANGSIGKANALLDKKSGKLESDHEIAVELLRKLSKSAKADFMLAMLSSVSKREELTALCETVSLGFRDLLMLRKTQGGTCLFFTASDHPEQLCGAFPIASLYRLTELFGHYRNLSLTNVNLQTTLGVLAEAAWSSK